MPEITKGVEEDTTRLTELMPLKGGVSASTSAGLVGNGGIQSRTMGMTTDEFASLKAIRARQFSMRT